MQFLQILNGISTGLKYPGDRGDQTDDIKAIQGMTQADEEPLTIDMRVPSAIRVLTIVVGAAIISIVVWEFGPAVWPPNIATPFFLAMILAAMTVAKPTILAGLFGNSDLWTVEKGRLTIDRHNWFRTEKLVFTPSDIDQFNVVEVDAMDGANTWRVVMWVRGWRPFETYNLQTKVGAERMRDEIIARLNGQTV